MTAPSAHPERRSSRVPVKVPIRVTSMEPRARFSEICETLVVSAHGCALRSPLKLENGSVLRLHNRGGREATAHVVFCQPMESDEPGFRLGAQLQRPENFWGLKTYPDDWRLIEMPGSAAQQSAQHSAQHLAQQPRQKAKSAVVQPQPPSQASREILDTIEEHLSEDHLLGILAPLVRPLQAEVTELREKIAANAKRNRFEVSLGNIPPELEQKLWERLQEDLAGRVLQQTQEQSAEIFVLTKSVLEEKIGTALTEFRHRLAGELHTVEQRAQVLSRDLTTATQQQVVTGVEKLQRKAVEEESNLAARSEKLLVSLQGQLASSQDAHRREIDQIQADTTAKASRLQLEVSDLSRRVAVINESVRRLESDLDAHLEKVASGIVSEAQTQLENAVVFSLKDLQARISNEVESELNETCGHLRTIQGRIESSFSGSLKVQGETALQSIAEQFEEVARNSTEKWRLALARDLSSVANTLGQQLRQEVEPEGN